MPDDKLPYRDSRLPAPFPLDFDLDDGPCLVCGSALDEEWICPNCGEDHFDGVMLLIGYGKARNHQDLDARS